MQVILLEKIHKLGELGDQVKVKPGYGRNFLFPNNKAVPATAANIAKFEQQRATLEKAQTDVELAAQARATALRNMAVTVVAKAGPEGKLYGSVGTGEIAEALTAVGETVQKREIHLPHGPLRELGEHAVDLQLHADVMVPIRVIIRSDGEPPVALAAEDLPVTPDDASPASV